MAEINDASDPVPESELMGKFCWKMVEGVAVPFILRSNDELFGEINMLKKTLFKKHLQVLGDSVFNTACPTVNMKALYTMTDEERDLLEDINIRCCERYFTERPYSVSSNFLLKKDDAVTLYHILKDFHDIAVHKRMDNLRFGFLEIDDTETPIPFVDIDNVGRVVPLLFFEWPNVTDVSFVLTDPWSIAYLKLGCKLLSILPSYYQKTTLKVIEVNMLKSIIPEVSEYTVFKSLPSKVKLDGFLRYSGKYTECNGLVKREMNEFASRTPCIKDVMRIGHYDAFSEEKPKERNNHPDDISGNIKIIKDEETDEDDTFEETIKKEVSLENTITVKNEEVESNIEASLEESTVFNNTEKLETCDDPKAENIEPISSDTLTSSQPSLATSLSSTRVLRSSTSSSKTSVKRPSDHIKRPHAKLRKRRTRAKKLKLATNSTTSSVSTKAPLKLCTNKGIPTQKQVEPTSLGQQIFITNTAQPLGTGSQSVASTTLLNSTFMPILSTCNGPGILASGNMLGSVESVRGQPTDIFIQQPNTITHALDISTLPTIMLQQQQSSLLNLSGFSVQQPINFLQQPGTIIVPPTNIIPNLNTMMQQPQFVAVSTANIFHQQTNVAYSGINLRPEVPTTSLPNSSVVSNISTKGSRSLPKPLEARSRSGLKGTNTVKVKSILQQSTSITTTTENIIQQGNVTYSESSLLENALGSNQSSTIRNFPSNRFQTTMQQPMENVENRLKLVNQASFETLLHQPSIVTGTTDNSFQQQMNMTYTGSNLLPKDLLVSSASSTTTFTISDSQSSIKQSEKVIMDGVKVSSKVDLKCNATQSGITLNNKSPGFILILPEKNEDNLEKQYIVTTSNADGNVGNSSSSNSSNMVLYANNTTQNGIVTNISENTPLNDLSVQNTESSLITPVLSPSGVVTYNSGFLGNVAHPPLVSNTGQILTNQSGFVFNPNLLNFQNIIATSSGLVICPSIQVNTTNIVNNQNNIVLDTNNKNVPDHVVTTRSQNISSLDTSELVINPLKIVKNKSDIVSNESFIPEATRQTGSIINKDCILGARKPTASIANKKFRSGVANHADSIINKKCTPGARDPTASITNIKFRLRAANQAASVINKKCTPGARDPTASVTNKKFRLRTTNQAASVLNKKCTLGARDPTASIANKKLRSRVANQAASVINKKRSPGARDQTASKSQNITVKAPVHNNMMNSTQIQAEQIIVEEILKARRWLNMPTPSDNVTNTIDIENLDLDRGITFPSKLKKRTKRNILIPYKPLQRESLNVIDLTDDTIGPPQEKQEQEKSSCTIVSDENMEKLVMWQGKDREILYKVVEISEGSNSQYRTSYKVTGLKIENDHTFICISKDPLHLNDLLISVLEITEKLFPELSRKAFMDIAKEANLTVYALNLKQKTVLKNFYAANNKTDVSEHLYLLYNKFIVIYNKLKRDVQLLKHTSNEVT